MRRLKLTKARQGHFLNALADTGSVTAAVAVAGTSRRRVYQLRKSDPEFAAAWDESEEIAADRLEDEARRRAVEGVPEKVWVYTLGNYQVVKKWLSYREQSVLGRALTPDEVAYVSEMVRRIAAILLMGPALDANYARAKANAVPWKDGRPGCRALSANHPSDANFTIPTGP
jgi:hypothetical protein